MYKKASSIFRSSKGMAGTIIELTPNTQHFDPNENKGKSRYKDKPIQSGVGGNQFRKPTLGSAKNLFGGR